MTDFYKVSVHHPCKELICAKKSGPTLKFPTANHSISKSKPASTAGQQNALR